MQHSALGFHAHFCPVLVPSSKDISQNTHFNAAGRERWQTIFFAGRRFSWWAQYFQGGLLWFLGGFNRQSPASRLPMTE